jgi:hypothetical protein
MRVPSGCRRIGAALVSAVVIGGLAPAGAGAGEYTVEQCGDAVPGFEDAVFDRTHGGDYSFGKHCGENAAGDSLQIRDITSAPHRNEGRILWRAPSGARIVAARVQGRLRRDSGHQARLIWLDRGDREAGRIAAGADEPAGFRSYSANAPTSGRQGFAAILRCERAGGCPASDRARSWVRELRLTLIDAAEPDLAVAGGLLAVGWRHGSERLEVSAGDAGSGVRRLEVTVNSRRVEPTRTLPCATVRGSTAVLRVAPCPRRAAGDTTLDTTKAPFRDGANTVVACAIDFGRDGNRACARRRVAVDNSAPELAFENRQDPEDPELIRVRARDGASGVATGRIAYRRKGSSKWHAVRTRVVDGWLEGRVDSSSEPKGSYRFRASATDRAGNTGLTTRRADGTTMVLRFPLRERSRVSARARPHRVAAYGSRPRVAGRLRGPEGRPLAGEEVNLLQRFAPGSARRRSVAHARTDRSGRYTVRLPRGPSRTVSVRYEGSLRYLPAAARSVRVGVRGRARLTRIPRRVRAGARARFAGSIGHLGVRMGPGKLVELQVREPGTGHFRTVKQAFRTDGRGRWRTSYGFGRFYTAPTRFQFRLRVPPESGWPYRAPTHSRARTLTVMPR